MQTKIRISAILLMLLLLALFPISAATANAQTFDIRKPAFGLYCENQNANIDSKIRYIIDGEGNAMQYSEYTITATCDLDFYIPFLTSLFNFPEIDITVNRQSATSEIWYGEVYSLFNEELNYNFYSTDLDGLTGTVYTITTASESFKVDFRTLENQNFIYRFPRDFTRQLGNGTFSYSINNAQTDIPYELFIINGDFAEFETTAEAVKETITVKEYIDRNFAEMKDYFSAFDNATPDLLYALINEALDKSINYDFFNFFFDSFSKQRINAYKVSAKTNDLPCTVNYSMPVYVQKNSSFSPAIFMTELTATGNYNIDYTIELNNDLPYIIESSADVKKQDDNLYTAENINGDFYFVFSASEKPQSIYSDNNGIKPWQIVLFVLLGVAVCAFIVSTTILIISVLKNRKQCKGNK